MFEWILKTVFLCNEDTIRKIFDFLNPKWETTNQKEERKQEQERKQEAENKNKKENKKQKGSRKKTRTRKN